MTRAKQNLTIHLNGNYLDNLMTAGLERIENSNTFLPPSGLVLHLSHKDLNLGYFEYVQRRVSGLTSGDALSISDEGCKNEKGELVLKFSRRFLERITEMKQKGFVPNGAKVNFIVYWTDDEKKIEVKIVLPELNFTKYQQNAKIQPGSENFIS
ncbi:hypothetical protein ACFSKL_02190 [Belliella marina]|uniref:Uncharacterized protein n=1 Tax=Belliella marina TaxID=1644146 RepID=A0ABW4VIE3_9BACT